MLKINKLNKSYGDTSSTDYQQVLCGVNFELMTRGTVAIMGPSGCGKSTLLNIIGCLDRPDSGSVMLNDVELTRLNEQEMARIRNESIGFVFQMHHLLPQCSVLENILLPVLAGRVKQVSGARVDRALHLLERVGMTDYQNKRPGELSGGQCQRTALVRALINQPRLLLADEPTGSLDQANAETLMELLLELNREEGTSLLVVTHAESLARHMNDIFLLENGQLKSA